MNDVVQAIRLYVVLFFASAISIFAAGPPRGADQLRELVVFPEVNLNFGLGIIVNEGITVFRNYAPLSDQIFQLRESVRSQPDDARLWMHLGDVLFDDGETNEANSCFQKAEQLCHAKVGDQPHDGLALTDLGAVLRDLEKSEEAESIYRKAVLVSSNDWRCWARLGNFLMGQSVYQLFATNALATMDPRITPQNIFEQLGFQRPSPEAIEKSDSFSHEASQCFARATALAPDESELYFQRAGYLIGSNWQDHIVEYLRNKERLEPAKWVAAIFSKSMIADLKKAAEIKPKDYQYITLAAWLVLNTDAATVSSWFVLGSDAATAPSPDFLKLAQLPDNDRKFVQAAITGLKDISQSPDHHTAAAALEGLGKLHFASQNFDAAKADLKRAIALDPGREQSWDMLTAILTSYGKPKELAAVCEARLKSRDSPRNHILMAEVLALQKKWAKATEQAYIADQLETNNIVPRLLIAAIALKQSARPGYLAIANQNLHYANDLLPTISNENERRKRWREFALNAAIFNGLSGETEDAKSFANEVLKNFFDDGVARQILKNFN